MLIPIAAGRMLLIVWGGCTYYQVTAVFGEGPHLRSCIPYPRTNLETNLKLNVKNHRVAYNRYMYHE